MLVFWKEKLALLAVPKTGTTALEKVLGPRASIVVSDPPELKHAPMYRYNRFFRPMFEKPCKTDDIETMAIIREPISWLSSWFRYRRRAYNMGSPTSTHDMSFDDFVLAYCLDEIPDFAKVGSQARFVEASKQGPGPDHMFRYEIKASWQGFLETRLACKIELPEVNASPQMDLSLSPRTEAQLRRVRADEFRLYDSIA